MKSHTTDTNVLKHITDLVAEEQALYERGTTGADATARLDAIRVELDQYWDLLRQRRALSEFGKNPDRAQIRPAAVVEKYEQ